MPSPDEPPPSEEVEAVREVARVSGSIKPGKDEREVESLDIRRLWRGGL